MHNLKSEDDKDLHRTCKVHLSFDETTQQPVFFELFHHARNEANTKCVANGKGVEPVTTYERVLFYCFSFLH